MPADDDERICVRLTCNETAMFYWALQYGLYVEVIEPVDLREKIREAVSKMSEQYEKGKK